MAQNPFLWWLPSTPDKTDDPKKAKKAPAADAPTARPRPARPAPAKAPASAKPVSPPAPAKPAAPVKPAAAPQATALQAAPQDRAGDLIRRAQQIAVALFLEECAAFDLTPVQYSVLTALRDNPGSDATRVGGLVGFDRTTISGVMERLEAKGLLARQTSEADKRIKTLTLTGEGRKLLKKVAPYAEQAQARILAPLSGQEQETLLALLNRLVQLNNDASRAPRRLPDAG